MSEGGGEPAGPTPGDSGATAPSDAFQALGSETRLDVVRALARNGSASFTTLFEDSDEDTSAGFAYHLRQLDDLFVRTGDEEYELTAAGREVGRAIRADTFTESVDRSSTALEERCPFCDERALEAAVDDGVTAVRCTACDSRLLDVSFPTGGYSTHTEQDLPDAVDTYHRHRIRSFADGVCPDCGGSVSTSVDSVDEDWDDGQAGALDLDVERPLVSFGCGGCGLDLRCPVTLTVLDHPAVVAFYHEHGSDVADRPIWNVGPEWREQFVSADPLCVRVSTRLDGEPAEALHLYVGEDLRVVDHRREPIPDDAGLTAGDGAAS